MMLRTLKLSNLSTTKLTPVVGILTILLREEILIEDNAMCIDDIKLKQTAWSVTILLHLLAIAQITIESSDIKDEDKYSGSLNMLNTNHMNNDHDSTASATIWTRRSDIEK